MNLKETKTLTKEIRDSIKAENYGDAIHKCQLLLKAEPKNYTAYLLLGAAYQKNDKTEAARYLRKAIEYCQTSPVTALQGLVLCAPTEELPNIYEQLLQHASEKREEYYQKLYDLSRNPLLLQECFNIFKKLATTSDSKENALEYLAKLWFTYDLEVSPIDHNLYKNAMHTLLRSTQGEEQIPAYKKYLKWLYILKDYAACIHDACNLISKGFNEIFAYEWICKIYCENYKYKNSSDWFVQLKAPIQFYAKQLELIDKKSGLSRLVNAIDLFNMQEFVSARELLRHAQQVLPNYKPLLELLAHVEMHLGVYQLAMSLWEHLGYENEEYAQCLSYETDAKQLEKAISLLKAFPVNNINTKALARCYAKLGDVDNLKTLHLDILDKAEFIMSTSEALECLDNKTDIESFDLFLLRGKLLLKINHYTEALTLLLKATRLRPYASECFYYLGIAYQNINDILRARKCFEKCVNLNAFCKEAINYLTNIYQQLGEKELNEILLLNATRQLNTENSVLLQYKLGLHYLEDRKWDNAIQAFRSAIKSNVNCIIYWECLGDAYIGRGSYNSAIRVFQKILKMAPEHIYAKLQIALIKMTIRMYTEAIEDFDLLLKEHPNYMPALKGVVEAHLGLSNNFKAMHFYGRAKDQLQLAINYLQRAILHGEANDMMWLWRLTANVCLLTAELPTSIANLNISGRLANREEEIAYVTREELLHLANRFYTCALQIKQNTYLWYELALCSYQSAIYLPEDEKTHIELAEKACKMAIKLKVNRWQNWNLLGVINLHSRIKNYAIAQHCFIYALNLDRKSFITWTNLGALYLNVNEIKLANQAFQRAQQSSPIYANSWIGQAMIAETINDGEEALDLFRHCQQFEYHPESALGYAYWVCNILANPNYRMRPHLKHAIEYMHADTVALDAVNWYIRNEEAETDVAVFRFQAYLCAHKKLYRIALGALLQALKITSNVVVLDGLYTDIGYLYLQLNEPEHAVNAFNNVAHGTVKSLIGLALAYYRVGQLQESFSVYESVLNSIEDKESENAASILVAMAAMVYEYQGVEDTKTLLYQCILLKKPPVQSLFSAAALGILHADKHLTDTMLFELRKYKRKEEYCADVAFLNAQNYISNGRKREALIYLLKCAHIYPNSEKLRLVCANFLLDNYFDNPSLKLLTSQFASSVLILAHHNSMIKNDAFKNAQILLIASRALRFRKPEESEKNVQRSMHLQPQYRHIWLQLLPKAKYFRHTHAI